MNDLHIITVANESKYYFNYLIESCINNGKDLEILGFGETWKGFNWRNKLILEYLQKLDLNDIICFIDGYDVICVRDLSTIKDDFIKIKNRENCKLIFGSEIPKSIINEHLNNTHFKKCKNLRLNFGTYIGYVSDILEIISKVFKLNSNLDANDQKLMIEYCNLNPNEIYIDKNSELFLTICTSLKEIDDFIVFNNNEIIYENSKPYFIHGPGSTLLDNIIIKLGYNYDKKVKYELYIKYFNENREIFISILLIFLLIIIKILQIIKRNTNF